MTFTETTLAGAFIIDIVTLEDERGFFSRTWSRDDFDRRGLDPTLAQCNVSWNKVKGTLRGMHFQRARFRRSRLFDAHAERCWM